MRAIRTRYVSPTSTRKARVVADSDGVKSVVLSWDDSLSTEENHDAAFTALRRAHHWYGPEYRTCGSGEFRGALYWVFQH